MPQLGLSHPGLLRHYEVGAYAGPSGVAREYLLGVSLAQVLCRCSLPMDLVMGEVKLIGFQEAFWHGEHAATPPPRAFSRRRQCSTRCRSTAKSTTAESQTQRSATICALILAPSDSADCA